MNTGNGNAHTDLVDRVLEGKDPETKTRVLQLIYRLRLEPTDDLLLFCIAIGYLETIITDAPEQWEAVFVNFRTNLEQWKTHHLNTLESSVQAAEQMGQLTRSLTRQTEYMNDLASSLRAMLPPSGSMTDASTNWAQASKEFSRMLDDNAAEQSRLLKRELNTLDEAIAALAQPLKALHRSSLARPDPLNPPTDPTTNRAVSGLLALLLVATSGSLWLLWKQHQITGWLLYKANRSECRLGLVSRQSAQCAPFR